MHTDVQSSRMNGLQRAGKETQAESAPWIHQSQRGLVWLMPSELQGCSQRVQVMAGRSHVFVWGKAVLCEGQLQLQALIK